MRLGTCVEYNKDLYNYYDLTKWAKRYVKKLPKDVTGLLSIGASGCAIASAMMVICGEQRELTHYHIKSKTSHQADYEPMTNIHNIEENVIAFVDDFFQTGETFRKVMEFIELSPHHLKEIMNIKYIITSNSKKSLLVLQARGNPVFNGITHISTSIYKTF